MSEKNNTIAQLEAMLFAAGDPVEPEKLADVLELDIENVIKMLGYLEAKYDESGSGLRLIRVDGKYQICTREAYADGVRAHMKKHAAILKPMFDIVLDRLNKELTGLGIASWFSPKGGYFISLDVLPGTAKRVGELCKAGGVTLTSVGATYPYGIDPQDSNIRIAPSFPPNEEMALAAELLCICTRLAAIEKLVG